MTCKLRAAGDHLPKTGEILPKSKTNPGESRAQRQRMTSFEPPDTVVFEFFISVGLEIPFLALANVNWRSSTCI